MTSTNENTDLRALADRPAPTARLDRPYDLIRTDADPVRKAAQDAAHAAGARYAALEAGKAAELIARVFPGAHRAAFSFQESDVDVETVATLRAVWNADGLMLWHSHGQIASHPDAAARAELEAYGGPVMPHLGDFTRDVIESLLSSAEEYGRSPFDIPDEAIAVRVIGDGQVESPDWCWQEEQGWLRELIVPDAIAKAQQIRDEQRPVDSDDLLVLTITYKHGTAVSLHRSQASVNRDLADFVREYWPDVAGRHGCPDQAPTDDGEAVRLYFETQADEGWSVDSATVPAAEPNPQTEATVERLVALVDELGVSGLVLGEDVHDMFSAQASDVNNGGLSEQVRCLVENFGADGAESRIREHADEDDDEDDDEQPATVACKFCHNQVPADTAHRHDGGYVGECCWDERLNATA